MEEENPLCRIQRYPVIIRPAFTLGGTGGGIAYNRHEFEEILSKGLDLSPIHQCLVEESILGWKEYEMEVMRDLKDNVVIICSIDKCGSHGDPYRGFGYGGSCPNPYR